MYDTSGNIPGRSCVMVSANMRSFTSGGARGVRGGAVAPGGTLSR